MADGAKKARRVEDVLDGADPFERIEGLLGAALSQPGRGSSALSPDEMSSREAAAFLGISTDTLDKLHRGGQLARRNASPPGSGKPRYRYRVADLERIKREGYRVPASSQQRPSRRGRSERPSAGFKSKHLDLD